jgi:hypothetical protein
MFSDCGVGIKRLSIEFSIALAVGNGSAGRARALDSVT